MALALSNAGRLTADIRLAQAVSKYEASLSDSQKAEFRTLRSTTQTTAPRIDDVMKLTAELDQQVRQKSKDRRCFGPRFTNVLRSVQQYAALGDIIIGGSQNLVACGVWCVVRMSLLLLTGYSSHMERFSTLFMAIGRSSPRYQDLALLYSNSVAIRRYLAEYFIVVVDICYQFLMFSQRSILGQFKSSLVDSDLHQAELKLAEWALNIKDEAEILNTRTLVGVARESSRFRALVDHNHRNLIHQSNIKRRTAWLDACTTYDHETPWKQARKRGHTSIFVNDIHYQQWKLRAQSSRLVMCGKIGSGKTVLTANIVDQLHLTSKETVCYFFCRHDIMYSCLARTIIGSLCRQLLSNHINEDTMDGFLGEYVQPLSFDDVVRLSKNALSLKGRCYLVLDGLDDCDDFERKQTTEALRKIQETTQLLLYVSLRSQVDEVETEFRGIRPHFVCKMPDDNPDISNFVLEALKEKVETGQLVLGDPSLIIEIRDALNAGAQGMFLWVVLQIECLCMEQTDDSIREALQNLPPDLSTTYDRILQKSAYRYGQSYQRQILSFLLATLRPLEITELSEALAVVPGDIKWRSEHQVNNINRTLKCCESLVLVAEEERTVHFVHRSVVQFLLDHKSTSAALRFDLAEASLALGEVCVTYLNYGIFDQRLSTNVVPTIPAGAMPAKIAQDTLKGTGLIGQLAITLLNLQSTNGPDLGNILTETSRIQGRRRETTAFEFLKYASQHWLIHTARICRRHSTFSLWQGLLRNPRFDGLVWGPNEMHPEKLVDDEPGNIWMLAPRVTWATSHSHLPLLLHELRGRRGLKAFCSIIPYIRILVKAGDRLKVDGTMALKLFEVAVVAGADDIANLLLQTHQPSSSREKFLDPFAKRGDHARVAWVVSLKGFGTLQGLEFPIVKFAYQARNIQLMTLALDLGARIDTHDGDLLVPLIQEMRDPMDLALACRLLKAGLGLKACDSMEKRLYWFLLYYALVGDPHNFEPYKAVMSSLGPTHDSVSMPTYENLIRRACLNGNLQMVQGLLHDRVQWSSVPIMTFIPPETLSVWMENALRTYSTERKEIVLLLIRLIEEHVNWVPSRDKIKHSNSKRLRSFGSTAYSFVHGLTTESSPKQSRREMDDWNSMWLIVFRRCLELRAWKLARTILRIPYIERAYFREGLMKFSEANVPIDGHNTTPIVGYSARYTSAAAPEDHGGPEAEVGAYAEKRSNTDSYEATTFGTSGHLPVIHLSTSCGDLSGLEFLLDVLGSDAHTILSISTPLDSCFGGDVPLQTLLSKEHSSIEESADLLRIGCLFLRSIRGHGSSACGHTSKSCVDLVPRFCAKVVQMITQVSREKTAPGMRPYRSQDEEESILCFPLLEDFLKAWIVHLPKTANPRRLLMPMLRAIVLGFREVRAGLESRIPWDDERLQATLKVHCRDHVDLAFVLARSLGEEGLINMFNLFHYHEYLLESDVARFRGIVVQEYSM